MLDALPEVHNLAVRWAMLLGGIVVTSFGMALYIGAGLGPGPRDGLMTGLVVRTGQSVRLVRSVIEVTVLTVGWLLGGSVGIGTVVYAFGIGPLVQLFVRLTPARVLAVSGWARVDSAQHGVDAARVEDVVGEHAGQSDHAGSVTQSRGDDLEAAGRQGQ